MILAITIITLVVLLIGWIFYLIAIKKEKDLNEMVAGLFFTSLFTIVFYFIIKLVGN